MRKLLYQLRRRWARRHLQTCNTCGGSGSLERPISWFPGELIVEVCFACDGTGLVKK